MTDARTEVVGREAELAAVRSFVAKLAAPSALVLEGAPGIGKTTLWEAGVAAAKSAGHRVLWCRPTAAETQLSFSAVADLLADGLDDALPTLPAPQQRALRIALLMDEPAGPPADDRSIAAGLLGVLRHACASTPVLIAVDDVQWLDDSSRTVLEFAVRRLRVERVGLLLGTRDSGGELPLGLGRALASTEIDQVLLGPLSMGALHRMIQARLGVAFSRPVLRRMYAASAGNPFYGLEIARALQRRTSAVGPGEPLPVPPTLSELVHERVSALGDGARRLLEIVATLYDRRLATVRELAHEEGLDGTIDDAVAAGVLGVHQGRLEFQHPLLASGVYAGMGPDRRREVHRRLAVRDTRNEAGTAHRALAADAPDAEVADELDRASAFARARGAAASAGRYAERAAHLTPPDDTEGWARRLTEAADHYLVAGDPGRTAAILQEVVERLDAGVLRARALSLLGWTSPGGDIAAGVRIGEQALAEATGDPALEALTRLRLGLNEWIRGNLEDSLVHGAAAAELAERVGDPALIARTLSALGLGIAVRDCVISEASRRAVEIEQSLPGFLGQYSPSVELGQVLMYAGEVDEARKVLEGALARSIAAGDEAAHCNCLYRLAVLERRAGNWARARVFSDATRELNAQAGTEQEYASCLAVGALLDAGTGRLEEARDAARTGLAAAERMDDAAYAMHHRGVLGFIELSLGNAEAAQAWLAPSTELLVRQGLGEISMYPAFQHDIDAAVQAGNVERAEQLVEHLEQLVARTGRSWTQAVALRGRGLILAAHGNLDAARTSLEHAILAHEAIPEPFELARTLLALGKLERRAKRKRASRETLERAAVIFAGLPAPLWQAKVDDELARLGIRAAPDGLTETEARIAKLAASGMTNPEIAATAFVSRKTVEANLSKVYRKLGVRSRVELARRLPPAET